MQQNCRKFYLVGLTNFFRPWNAVPAFRRFQIAWEMVPGWRKLESRERLLGWGRLEGRARLLGWRRLVQGEDVKLEEAVDGEVEMVR